jgi:hypothetical protein
MLSSKWNESKVDVFWGEIAPCQHVVQIYDNEVAFIDLLAEFVLDGLHRDETIVLILTPEHLQLLDEKLRQHCRDGFTLRLSEKVIIEDAQQTLSGFMIGAWPDEFLFRHVIGSIMAKASKSKRPIRAFGEMVVLLWTAGLTDATIQLEHLWNELQKSETFCLFCAYPRAAFLNNDSDSILTVCGAHSKIVSVDNSPGNVLYRDLSINKI